MTTLMLHIYWKFLIDTLWIGWNVLKIIFHQKKIHCKETTALQIICKLKTTVKFKCSFSDTESISFVEKPFKFNCHLHDTVLELATNVLKIKFGNIFVYFCLHLKYPILHLDKT